MRVPRLGLAIVCFGCAGLLSGEALQITTTPSHTATHTPTPTPTATSSPTVVATPKPTPWAVFGGEFQVNTTSTGDQFSPAVAIGANDGFVIVWTDGQQNGSGSGLIGRRFDAIGNPLSAEFPINSITTGDQAEAAIASGPGGFVVAWSSSPDATGLVLSRRLAGVGGRLRTPRVRLDRRFARRCRQAVGAVQVGVRGGRRDVRRTAGRLR